MKAKYVFSFAILALIAYPSCKKHNLGPEVNIAFLHHSTGAVIWKGGEANLLSSLAGKFSNRLAGLVSPKALLPKLFEEYNKLNQKNYFIRSMVFPKSTPYGWNNYPFDYYNIWVKNAGNKPFMEEPTLEILTEEFDVIILKHCYPVNNIKEDILEPDILSDNKTLANFKLQYLAIREKLLQYPETKFILFTGAARIKSGVTEDEAKRASQFFSWVTEEWDLPNDNIYIWDLYQLQTEGGLYLKEEFAVSETDSHPNDYFAAKAAPLLFQRIIDIIENNGNRTNNRGEII